eukprot:1137345-Pelagomonas_calceolata.AAC.6
MMRLIANLVHSSFLTCSLACPGCAQVASVEYDNFLGRIAVGRVMNGTIKKGQQVNGLKANN